MRADAHDDLVHTNVGVGGNLAIYRRGRGLLLVGSLVPSDAPSKRAVRQKCITYALLMFACFFIGVVFTEHAISGVIYFAIPAIGYFWIKTWINRNGQVITTIGLELLVFFQDYIDRIWQEGSRNLIDSDATERARIRAEIDRKFNND